MIRRMKEIPPSQLSELTECPYYSVIFTSQLTDTDTGYAQMTRRMLQLASQHAGFLGVDSARENHRGITVSYWKDEASIQRWKQQIEHLHAQKLGKTRWYDEYTIRIAKVERSYAFKRSEDNVSS